uniref:Ankyrin repeat domain containing protein n=1 Tax=Echinococcus granulosus TaxID=6210 RepID=A0A068W8N5_ECHGR|nr:Ankyrin repeat domain containing protein [Echinococcus granulosus]
MGGEEGLPRIVYPRAHFYLEEALCEAACTNDLNRARRILMERVDPNWINGFGLSPLHIACKNGNFEVAKILVCNRAIVDLENAIGVTPLHLAAKNNHLKCAQLLLLSGAAAGKPTWSLCTPREYAPSGSRLRKVLELAEQGIPPDPAHVFEMSVEPLVPKFSIPPKPPEREQKNNIFSIDVAPVGKKKR